MLGPEVRRAGRETAAACAPAWANGSPTERGDAVRARVGRRPTHMLSQGIYLRHIESHTGARVHLRGQGSGYNELIATGQAPDKLHILVTYARE